MNSRSEEVTVTPEERPSFLQGAFILAVAGLMNRFIGAVVWLIVPIFLADVGLGLFRMAFNLYTALLALPGIGIPIALAKLVAEREGWGDRGGALRIFRITFVVLLVVGLAVAVLAAAGAPYYATHILKDPRAAYTIIAIAPAIFIFSIVAAFRGLFQGLQRMTPYGVSQMLEQPTRAVAIFALLYLLVGRGQTWGAVGVSAATIVGGVFALAYLAYAYYRQRDDIHAGGRAERPEHQAATSAILARLVKLGVPISIAGTALTLLNFADSILIPARLHAAGYGTEIVTSLYGMFAGKTMVLVGAPTVITGAIAFTLMPAISEALAGKIDPAEARTRARSGFRMAILLMLPASVGLLILARDIPAVLWNSPEVGPSLAVLSFGVVFLAVQQISVGILQGMGRPDIPVVNLLIGLAFKVAILWVLVAIPSWNIVGAAVSSLVAFFVASSLNLWVVGRRLQGGVIDPRSALLKPALSSLVMAAGVIIIRWVVLVVLGSPGLAVLASIGGGATLYFISLAYIGGISRADLEFFPSIGDKIARRLAAAGLLAEDQS